MYANVISVTEIKTHNNNKKNNVWGLVNFDINKKTSLFIGNLY